MKKLLVLLLVAVLALSAVAVAETEDKIVIGMAMIDYTNTGFVGMKTGMDNAAKDYGMELIWKGCEGSVDGQIDVIRGFIQQGVDVIMIDSVDVNAVVDVVNEATDAGIDVLAIGSSIAGKDNFNAVYPDYIDSKFAAEVINLMYEGQEGTIGLVAAAPGNLVSDNRQRGFEEVMAKYDNFNLVTVLGQCDASTAMTETENIINSNDDVIHIHCIQDGMSYGVLLSLIHI